MDVADRMQSGQAAVKDILGEKAQKIFQDFLEQWTVFNLTNIQDYICLDTQYKKIKARNHSDSFPSLST